MTLDSILKSLTANYPNLTRQEVRAIATDIYYSGESVEEITANSSTMEKLIDGYKTRQEATVKRVAAEDPTVCPICKLPLKPVKLAEGRSAVYCSKHFVVFPTPPNKDK